MPEFWLDWFCVCQHGLCGFVSVTVISSSDDSISQHYPSSYLLYASSCRMFPEPWLGEDCNKGSFSGLETQSLMLSTFQLSRISALITVPQIKKLFWCWRFNLPFPIYQVFGWQAYSTMLWERTASKINKNKLVYTKCNFSISMRLLLLNSECEMTFKMKNIQKKLPDSFPCNVKVFIDTLKLQYNILDSMNCCSYLSISFISCWLSLLSVFFSHEVH